MTFKSIAGIFASAVLIALLVIWVFILSSHETPFRIAFWTMFSAAGLCPLWSSIFVSKMRYSRTSFSAAEFFRDGSLLFFGPGVLCATIGEMNVKGHLALMRSETAFALLTFVIVLIAVSCLTYVVMKYISDDIDTNFVKAVTLRILGVCLIVSLSLVSIYSAKRDNIAAVPAHGDSSAHSENR
jgi:hypothetical protein